MRLQEIMNTEVVTVGPDETAGVAWSRMQRRGIRHLVVTDGARLLGVLSERDLGGRQGGALRRGRIVRDLMTAQVTSAKPVTTLRQAANLMRGRLIGALPVLEDGRVVGIVTATDVLEELGRGSSRPDVRARRQSMRLPPASARRATAKRAPAAKRGTRAAGRVKRGGNAGPEPGDGGGGSTLPEAVKITGRITPALGRDRVRQPDSSRRAPMPARVARPAKRTAGPTPTALTPANIRSTGSILDAADEDYIRRKLGRKLGKFASVIERASVRVGDVNGPKGGIDKRCLIKVVLSALPSVVVEERHESLQAAVDRALARTERSVRQAVERRREKSLRPRRIAGRAAVSE